MARRPRTEALVAAERLAERLQADPRVRIVFLFGSAADANAATVGDLDFGIVARPPLPAPELMALRAELTAEARTPVDLVDLERASVVLRKEVADQGRCLYARAEDEALDFIVRARSRFWDFRPYLEVQWRLAAERREARR